ncbi:peptide chain release factor N(5)-glutamine methyltransferase [Bacillota bacterium]
MNLLLKDILNMAETRFGQEMCLSPRLDAELLFCHMVGRERSWLFLHYGDELDDKTCEEYFALVDIRAGGMPLQYITGSQEFMGLEFKVNEHVLIPRQDTELLVEKTLEELTKRKPPVRGHHILDLCCGSGAIAVSLACHLKKKKIKASITASDISPEALNVARHNAAANGAERMIEFAEGDLFSPFPISRKGKAKRRFNVITCNPPYIPSRVIPTLMREVRDHEPVTALDGGEEGLDFYIRILREAHIFLAKGGIMFLEIGHDQGKALSLLTEAAGAYGPAEILKDASGNDRLAIIRLRDASSERS